MQKINFGCGLCVTSGWRNFDASPTLRLQRLPFLGRVMQSLTGPLFPAEAVFGDIVRGLPESDSSADLVYCSHVLEHLSLHDFRKALENVFRVLKPGGVFRGVLPDLAHEIKMYLANPEQDACSTFMQRTYLGITSRPRGLVGFARTFFGNSHHLWMWDYKGICAELNAAGFVNVRRAELGDSEFIEFNTAEDPSRWGNCLGFECMKPEQVFTGELI